MSKHQEVAVADCRLAALAAENPQKALMEQCHQASLVAKHSYEAPIAEYLQGSTELWKHPEAVVVEPREAVAEARKNE
ncbi:hypothetical protein W01_24790 [Candidatus Nitrotoga sp. AM1P]|nr:hypothetical protein W01_24790 [Candidatus Nitrotoga sp. AM1P]